MGFPGSSVVKYPPAMQKTQFRSLGQKDPPEKEMAIHSSVLGLEITWTEDRGAWQAVGSQELGTT